MRGIKNLRFMNLDDHSARDERQVIESRASSHSCWLFGKSRRPDCSDSGKNNDLATSFVFLHQEMRRYDLVQIKGLPYLEVQRTRFDLAR